MQERQAGLLEQIATALGAGNGANSAQGLLKAIVNKPTVAVAAP